MEKQQVQIDLGYRIAKIHTTKFTCEDNSEERIDQLFSHIDGLGINIQTSLSIDHKKSIITIDFGTELIDKENGKALVEHSGRTSFYIQGLNELYNKEKESYDLPDDFAIQLYGIAYTHARALLAAEISPTAYKDKYFLPVVDPTQFIKGNLKEESESQSK
jgi:hypothetical protein